MYYRKEPTSRWDIHSGYEPRSVCSWQIEQAREDSLDIRQPWADVCQSSIVLESLLGGELREAGKTIFT